MSIGVVIHWALLFFSVVIRKQVQQVVTVQQGPASSIGQHVGGELVVARLELVEQLECNWQGQGA